MKKAVSILFAVALARLILCPSAVRADDEAPPAFAAPAASIFNIHLSEWTAKDTILELTFIGITTVDWMQTIRFTQDSSWMANHTEMNPILGSNPSRAKVNTLIPLAMLGHFAVARILPQPWRAIWQMTWITVEGAAVANNTALGIGLSVPW